LIEPDIEALKDIDTFSGGRRAKSKRFAGKRQQTPK
jgi:hypothetical protein